MLEDGRPTLNPALRSFWTASHAPDGYPVRNRVLYGGRMSSKSWDAAGFAIFLAQRYKVRFLCTRQIQNKIEESVYTLLKNSISRFGLNGQFHITDNKIRHKVTGSSFVFYGLWRHVEEIKSLEAVDIHWSEEAHGLTEDQWRVINPTLRSDGSQHWLIFNPRLATDFVWQHFVADPPRGTLTRKINYDENPFLSRTALDEVAELERRDPEEYRHVYLGEPLTDDDQVIIKRSWIDACIDAHVKLGIKPAGLLRIGYDPADDGPDANATVTAYGCLTTNASEWQGLPDDLVGSCKRVHAMARDIQAKIYYDSCGIGAFAGGKFREINQELRTRIQYEGFGAGDKLIDPDGEYQPGVANRDYFANLKAQAWWTVAARMLETYNAVERGHPIKPDNIISINSKCDHIEKLKTELSTPHRAYSAHGLHMAEKKSDMLKRGFKSTNLADAFIMAYNPLVHGHVDWRALL